MIARFPNGHWLTPLLSRALDLKSQKKPENIGFSQQFWPVKGCRVAASALPMAHEIS
jgi:hypothetical protein